MRNTTSEFLTARLRNFRGVNFAIDIVRVVNISGASHVIITRNGDMLMNRCNSLPAFESGRRHILT